MSANTLVPGTNLPSKLVLVVDWDDTCLCSTMLTLEAMRQKRPVCGIIISPMLQVQLRKLEATVIAFLTVLQRYGTIYFVTNSETGWVLMSALRFLPKVVPFLRGPKAIPIISAIDLYKLKGLAKPNEAPTPTLLVEWKYHAICCILRLERKHKIYLFSIGDSNDERGAATRIRDETTINADGQLGYTSPIKVRSLKLSDAPSIIGLARQLLMLCMTLSHLIYTEPNDDIKVLLPASDVAVIPEAPKSAPTLV